MARLCNEEHRVRAVRHILNGGVDAENHCRHAHSGNSVLHALAHNLFSVPPITLPATMAITLTIVLSCCHFRLEALPKTPSVRPARIPKSGPYAKEVRHAALPFQVYLCRYQ